VSQNGRSHNYTLRATAVDDVGVVSAVVTMNGQPFATFADAFEATVSLRQRGTYTFVVTAQDAAGLVGSQTVVVTR
jgi:hypothetical protein